MIVWGINGKCKKKIRELDEQASNLLVSAIKDASEKTLILSKENPQNFKSEKDIKTSFLKLLIGSFEDQLKNNIHNLPFAESENPELEIKNIVRSLKHSTCLTPSGKITNFVENGALSKINLGQVGSAIGAGTDLGLIGHKFAKLTKAFSTGNMAQIGAAIITATGCGVLTAGKIIGAFNPFGNNYARDNSTVAVGNTIVRNGLFLESLSGFSNDTFSIITREVGAISAALTAGSFVENADKKK